MLTRFTEDTSAADVVLTRLASSSWEEASQEVVYDEQGKRLFTCYLVLGATEQQLSNFSVRPNYLLTVLSQQCTSFGLQISVFSLICHFKKLQCNHKLNLVPVLGYMKKCQMEICAMKPCAFNDKKTAFVYTWAVFKIKCGMVRKSTEQCLRKKMPHTI